MKKGFLRIMTALICGIWFTSSCNEGGEEGYDESALSIKAVVFSSTSVRSALIEDDLKVDTFVWCKGNNIEWYNETTGELKMKKIENEDVHFLVDNDDYWDVFYVYLGEKILFKLAPIRMRSDIHNYPVIIEDIGKEGEHNETHKYYIGRGYPNWEYWTEQFWIDTNVDKVTSAFWVEERERNWNAIDTELNIFIEQLKKEGKYRK